ncbi:MAG: hypothetical protein ACFFD4_02600 [Candidatus Odinarchaeota archaeon]
MTFFSFPEVEVLVSNRKKKCRINVGEGRKRVDCEEPVVITLKVEIFHFNSGRTSKQTWPLCGNHAGQFFEDDGKGWYAYYFRTGKEAPVTGYELLTPV